MRNSIRLKNISLFRISIILCLNLYYRNIYLLFISLIFLLLENILEPIFMIGFYFLLIILINNRSDFMRYGIVDYAQNSYCIVDKIFYKVKVINNEELKAGDILYFTDKYEFNDNSNQVKKNILFYGSEYKKLFNFYPRRFIQNRIELLDNDISALLKKIFYNINSYEDFNYNFGYGLISYYFLNSIRKRSPSRCIICIFLYSVFIVNEFRFVFLLIDCIAQKRNIDPQNRFAIKLLLICFINFELFRSYSIFLPLLFSLYRIFSLNIDFMTYLMIISSLLFGEINLINTFLFSIMMKIRVFTVLGSFVLLIIPEIKILYKPFINLFSMINNINLPIRGTISVVGLLIYLLIYRYISDKRSIIKSLTLLIVILLPINNPFCHVTFIDVGQGDAIMVKNALSKSSVLIDTGSVYNYHKLNTFLNKEGIYVIDKLIITHDDSDHNGNVDKLKKDYLVKEIVTEGKDFAYNKLYFDHLDLGEFNNDNDNSLVYMLNIDGISFLFTGDISEKAERVLIQKFGPLDIDILKVSHHGSYTGTSRFLISSILPEFAVISTSGQYNHPHKSVLKTLDKYLVKYFITSKSGNVSVYFTRALDFIKTGKNEFVIIS